MSDVILSLKKICKSFPGVQALDDVSIEFKRGTVHALLGENGAGKSTFIKIISGIYKMDSGSMELDGKASIMHNPREALEGGIAVVHQELNLIESLSVAENIFMGKLFKKGMLTDWKKVHKESKKLLDEMDIEINTKQIVEELSIALRQVVEICKAMTNEARIFILDEPTATLTTHEIEMLFKIIRKIKENGCAIIYISHRLEEVFEICDELTVLRDGKFVGTRKVSESSKEELIRMMVGRDLSEEFPKKELQLGETVLEVENFRYPYAYAKSKTETNIYLRKREILGFAGLVGAGRTELMRALLGVDKSIGGKVTLHGKAVWYRKFWEAIKDRFGFVTEDRKRQGLVLEMPVKNNISLATMRKISKNGFISSREEKDVATKYIDKLKIATPSENAIVKFLSGGNQQKVVIAKWLQVDAEIIVLDEPTRGIDVGAKLEIYNIMNELVDEGKSIIMISSEMPELMGMCDRIYIMHEGEIKGVLNRTEFSSEKILSIAFS